MLDLLLVLLDSVFWQMRWLVVDFNCGRGRRGDCDCRPEHITNRDGDSSRYLICEDCDGSKYARVVDSEPIRQSLSLPVDRCTYVAAEIALVRPDKPKRVRMLLMRILNWFRD